PFLDAHEGAVDQRRGHTVFAHAVNFPNSSIASASLTTSAIFACISNRFCSCGRTSRSPQASRITNGAKPRHSASSAEARTQPEVEKPVRNTVSTPAACNVEARWVAKKADGYCLVTTSSFSAGCRLGGKAPCGLPFTNAFSAGTFLKNRPPLCPPGSYSTMV